MGVYVQLDCLDCRKSLSFGKPIRERDGRIKLCLSSERTGTWHEGVECWHALQAFLFSHRDHRLVFRKDDTADAQNMENDVEFDDLLDLWTKGAEYE
jgi:hypothetical protein